MRARYRPCYREASPGSAAQSSPPPPAAAVVFFCAFGERSAMAVAAAKSAGLVNTAHIEGGYRRVEEGGWAGGDG